MTKCYWCQKELVSIENEFIWSHACPIDHCFIKNEGKLITRYRLYVDIEGIRYEINGNVSGTTVEKKSLNSLKYISNGYKCVTKIPFMMPLVVSENGIINVDAAFIDRIVKLSIFS